MVDVPESVLTYFAKPSVRSAVDLLLLGRRHRVPESLQWTEVPSFYSACLAARQTPAEYAILLAQLWTTIWQDGPKAWTPCPPEPPMRTDLGVGVENIWEEKCFTRCFKKDDRTVEFSVAIFSAHDGVQIAICIYDSNDNPLYSDALREAGWEFASEYNTFWTPAGESELNSVVDLGPLYAWRDVALRIVGAAGSQPL
jgi:hypothetical protein